MRISLTSLPLVFLLTGCSAVSLMNYSGAEVLDQGEHERVVGVSYAPNILAFLRDSIHRSNNSFDPLFEVRWRASSLYRLELGAGVWTSGFPVSTIAVGAADLGARLDARYLLTRKGSDHGLALLGTASGYYAVNTFTSFDSYERSYGGTWGGGGGVIYEYVLDHDRRGTLISDPSGPSGKTGIYTGAVVRYLYSDYTYGLSASESSSGVEEIRARIDHNALFLSPFIGMRLKGPIYIEVSGLMVRPPGSNEGTWGLFGGIGFGRR